ncbi:hypothetical protein H8E77_34650 [bacterium]|nr:hypothetical protein [bacterium]
MIQKLRLKNFKCFEDLSIQMSTLRFSSTLWYNMSVFLRFGVGKIPIWQLPFYYLLHKEKSYRLLFKKNGDE